MDKFKMVPVEPTEEMYLAFCDARGEHGSTFKDGLRAAIAAASDHAFDEAAETRAAKSAFDAAGIKLNWSYFCTGYLACARLKAGA